MAGIGFKLKKAFTGTSLYIRYKATIHAGSVIVGTWLWSAVILYVITLIAGDQLSRQGETIIIQTVLYSLIFAHILLSPIHLVIVRYIADMIYTEKYGDIRRSFYGLNMIIIPLSILSSSIYYNSTTHPVLYKISGVILFTVISMTMSIMIYLSSSKDYEGMGKSYMIGFAVSILSVFVLTTLSPLSIPHIAEQLSLASMLIGMIATYIMLYRIFIKTYKENNGSMLSFLKYYKKVPSFGFIALFYTIGIWSGNFIMDTSNLIIPSLGSKLPKIGYDLAVILGLLPTLVSAILYTVFIETEFFTAQNEFMNLVNGVGTLSQIKVAKKTMEEILSYNFVKGIVIQAAVTFLALSLYSSYFKLSGIDPSSIWTVMYCLIGSLFVVYAYINLNILLYFDMRFSALISSLVFLLGNMSLTMFFALGEPKYYGMGYMIASIMAFLVSSYLRRSFMKDAVYIIFSKQNVFKG